MKALFLYNPNSGKHIKRRKLEYIRLKLSSKYDLDVVASKSVQHFEEECKIACKKYDVLIVGGGDGTINIAINIIAKAGKRPIFGIVPIGTVNDAVKNISSSLSYKKVVKTLLTNSPHKMDIMKINDHYAFYVAAIGTFSNLPYITSNFSKKILGKFAYYFKCLPQLFYRKQLVGKIKANGNIQNFTAPFLFVLNGKRMGGFSINKNAIIDDGLIDLYLGKKSFLNSIPKYLLFRNKISHITSNEFDIHIKNDMMWDIDGERFISDKVHILVLNNYLEIIN